MPKTIFYTLIFIFNICLSVGIYFANNAFFFLNKKIFWVPIVVATCITLALPYYFAKRRHYFFVSFLLIANVMIWWHALAQPIIFTHGNKTLYFSNINFNSQTGDIYFGSLLGLNPPSSGAFTACDLSFEKFTNFFKAKPRLCISNDIFGRMTLHYNERDLGNYFIREFIFQEYGLSEQTLLKEPYQQKQTRLIYSKNVQNKKDQFHIREYFIFHLAELENGPAKILETLSYDGDHHLISFTETSLFNARQKDVFAEYDARGKLISRPHLNTSFIFPSKINIERFKKYQLARYLP